MSQPTKKKDTPAKSTKTAEQPPALLLEKALLACMPAPSVAGLHDRENDGVDNTTQANTKFPVAEKRDDSVNETTLDRSAPRIEQAVLACMPGAFRVPGSPLPATTANPDNEDPLHDMLEEAEEERPPVSAGSIVDIECEEQQQSTQTNIVSAYRVADEEPTIIATPFKDNRSRNLIFAVLVTAAAIALVVGLSVGLTTEGKQEQASKPVDHLVSSVLMTADEEGSFVKANRYSRTENGNEIVFSTGSVVFNYCEVIACNDGGCGFSLETMRYEPGCCHGSDCSPSDKCGLFCPEGVCHPTSDQCIMDSSCFECERGPNGEALYRMRDASFSVNCLRTGVATGFNDKDDNIERIYKWAIICGFNIEGGSEWINLAPSEYGCVAFRIGNGITKSVSIPMPCQNIQLAECGCAPDDIHTIIFPTPDKPCKTKQDCPYLCGDAGEEEAKMLCEVFPGIEWWEGKNPIYQSLFVRPEEGLFGNVTIQIDIYGD